MITTNKIEFTFMFLADEHEHESKQILRREIDHIIKDTVVNRTGIDEDDILDWHACLGDTCMHSSVSGFQYQVMVTINLKQEMEINELGYINHRWGGH